MGRNAKNFLAKHQGRGWLKLLGLRSQGVLHGLKLQTEVHGNPEAMLTLW